MSVTRNMELRHLSYSHTAQLSQILDNNDSWKSLMEKIPKNLDDIQNVANDSTKITRKYSADNVKQIDSRSKELRSSPTQILLDEWGTSGKKRATVSDLLELLIKVQLYRAADFVAKDILRESPPKRPENGPGARIDVSLPVETLDEQAIERILNNVGYPYTSQLAAQMIEKSIDSLINNNNRDISNAINVDHHKFIFNSGELISDQFESDTSESDTDLIKFSAAPSNATTTTNNNNLGSTSSSASSASSSAASLSAAQSSSSSMLQTNDYNNLPANLPMAYSNNNCDKQSNAVNHPLTAMNEIETSVSSSSSSSSSSVSSSVASSGLSYTCSNSNQMNQSTLIPDIDNLQIRDQSSEQLSSSQLPSSSSFVNVEQHLATELSSPLTHSTMTTNNDDAKNLSEYIPNLSLLNGTSS